MKGTIISRIYDALLYAYCYTEIWLNQQWQKAVDLHANLIWIKKNGVYKGNDTHSDD